MAKLLLLIFFISFLASMSFACEGEFKGIATIEMKEDKSICIKVIPEGQQSESKCFQEDSKEYKEIQKEFKELKPGDILEISKENC